MIGVEGTQAARSGDYAIVEFRHLKRLLFVWGRESYRRNSTAIVFIFYKAIIATFPQYFWAIVFQSGSGAIIYNEWLFQLTNLLFHSLPIFYYGVMDRDADYSFLQQTHRYYYPGQRNLFSNAVVFCLHLAYTLVQSLVILLLW